MRRIVRAALALVLVSGVMLSSYAQTTRRATLEEFQSALPTLHGEELAMAHLAIGRLETDPARAALSLKKAHDLSEKYRAEALLSMGELSLLIGDEKAAGQFFERAEREGPKTVAEKAAYLKASALYMEGRYQEAREAFADYLIDHLGGPNQSRARLGIAASNEALGRTAEAAEIYRAVLDQEIDLPEEPWILDRLIRLYEKVGGRYAEIRKYREVLDKKYANYPQGKSGMIPAGAPTIAAGQPAGQDGAVSEPKPPAATVRKDVPANLPSPEKSNVNQRPADSPVRAAKPDSVRKTSAKGNVFIQVGAFGVKENAEKLRSRLRENGYESTSTSRRNLTIVLAGPFEKRADAEKEKAAMERLLDSKVLIVTHP